MPMQRGLYPADWDATRLRILDRAGNRCEFCGVPNKTEIKRFMEAGRESHWAHDGEEYDGEGFHVGPVRGTGGIYRTVLIILTVARLYGAGQRSAPVQLPFLLQVTRYAVADEVVDLVGFLVPRNPEDPEWDHMVDGWAASEFFRGSAANGAGFLVFLPCGATGRLPCGTVVLDSEPPAPVFILLTDLRLFTEPVKPAGIAAEPTPGADIVPADLIGVPAPFAGVSAESTLHTAHQFSATGRRTSLAAIRRLIHCEWEVPSADDAIGRSGALSRATSLAGLFGSEPPRSDAVPQTLPGAGHAPQLRRGDREVDAAYDTSLGGGGSPGTCHAAIYHLDHNQANNDDRNLKALCQRCHLRLDAQHHAETARATRRTKKHVGQMNLLEDL